jgi:hypothetical protein
MLKLKQNERDILSNLFKTELGRAALSSFKEVIIRGPGEPVNASEGQIYSILMAKEEAKLDLLRYFIKLGEKDGK